MQHRLRAIPHLARNMGLMASFVMFLCGFIILICEPYRQGLDGSKGGPRHRSPHGVLMFLVCICGGVGMLAFELFTFARATVMVQPWLWWVRVVGYLGLCLPCFAFANELMPPLLPGMMYLLVGCLNLAAVSTQVLPKTPEEWEPPAPAQHAYAHHDALTSPQVLPKTPEEWEWKVFGDTKEKEKMEEQGAKYLNWKDYVLQMPRRLCDLYRHFRETNLLARYLFIAGYTLLNFILYMEAMTRHRDSAKGQLLRGEFADGIPVLKQNNIGNWYPIAKGFGQMLNLNCAVLVLPVVRSLVMYLHDLSSLNPPWYLRWITYVSGLLDKNIVFHKSIAKYFILVSVLGHSFAHYYNYSSAPYYGQALGANVYDPSPTHMAWAFIVPGEDGMGPGLSGQLLCLVMLVIYAGAHEKVRRVHYETFWYSHHFFILFFFLLLLHGPVWKFWCLPALVPYAIDRLIIRLFYRGNKRMSLMRIYFWGKPDKPDVITLQFDNRTDRSGMKPLQYREGHYLYLQCPAVERGRMACLKEWHPFTISSAPDEPVLEVNIRVMPSPHAWTNKVMRYLQLLDPHKTGDVELTTRNPETGEMAVGKVFGPDGQMLFRIDAPHGAPSQHVFQYNTCVLVGAGIGVTPCASIMKGVVHYRWKKGYPPANLHFYWVARRADLDTFRWLITLLPVLQAEQLRHNGYYGGDLVQLKKLEKTLRSEETNLEQLEAESSTVEPGKVLPDGTVPASSADAPLPDGWCTQTTAEGEVYYWNKYTNLTSWDRPRDLYGELNAKRRGVEQLRGVVKEAISERRELSITLFLTGCKPEEVQKVNNAKKGSLAELVNLLLDATDETGKPYIKLIAGRPRWDKEFANLRQQHKRETIGVVFCGAPMIAAALKEQCEKNSDASEGTLFRLHKENF